jgi:hypothetical protein
MKNLIILLIASLSLNCSENVTFKGKLLSSDGTPLKMGTIKIYGDVGESNPKLIAHTGSDGTFNFTASKNEIHWLEFSGVDHFPVQDYIVPSMYDKEIEFDIKLKQIFPEKHRETIALIVKNGEQDDYESLEMKKNEEGLFYVDYDNKYDTLKYQLFGHLNEQRATNGNMADSYEYDGFGDYNSLIINRKGNITITFDPDKFSLIIHGATKCRFAGADQ